jgi:hypothetical protein
MRHSDFRIGIDFWCGGKRWRCTDVGSRVVVATSLEPHEVVDCVPRAEGVTPGQLQRYFTDDPSWLVGPPYAVVECVFDEGDLAACSPNRDPVPHGNTAI